MRNDFPRERGGTTSLPNRCFGDDDSYANGVRQCDRLKRQYGSGSSGHAYRRAKRSGGFGKLAERGENWFVAGASVLSSPCGKE